LSGGLWKRVKGGRTMREGGRKTAAQLKFLERKGICGEKETNTESRMYLTERGPFEGRVKYG